MLGEELLHVPFGVFDSDWTRVDAVHLAEVDDHRGRSSQHFAQEGPETHGRVVLRKQERIATAIYL